MVPAQARLQAAASGEPWQAFELLSLKVDGNSHLHPVVSK